MTNGPTVTLPRKEYDALVARAADLEDVVESLLADDGVRVPHAVAVAIMGGERPMRAYRKHRGMTLHALSAKTGLAAGYLSEMERGRKHGSPAALARIAAALGATVDALLID